MTAENSEVVITVADAEWPAGFTRRTSNGC
jgi:hypothetical protein